MPVSQEQRAAFIAERKRNPCTQNFGKFGSLMLDDRRVLGLTLNN